LLLLRYDDTDARSGEKVVVLGVILYQYTQITRK
jgi:hypothetical protein